MLTSRITRLRALDTSDAETMWLWYQDHEFSVLDGAIYPSSRSTIEEFLRSLPAPSFGDVSLGIETHEGALIGIIRLKRVRAEDRSADFGIAIAKPWWNRGYGTDATETILRFAFEEMRLHRVSLTVQDHNARARRVYEKCGFVEEGVLRQRRWRFGRWIDVIAMSILEDEYRARHHPADR